MEFLILLATFIGGAVFWHLVHGKLSSKIDLFESRMKALENKVWSNN